MQFQIARSMTVAKLKKYTVSSKPNIRTKTKCDICGKSKHCLRKATASTFCLLNTHIKLTYLTCHSYGHAKRKAVHFELC
jgi:hypothetical protein